MGRIYKLPKAGEVCLSSDQSMQGVFTGTQQPCRLEGCTGVKLGVRWSDRRLTWPCSKGLTKFKGKTWMMSP